MDILEHQPIRIVTEVDTLEDQFLLMTSPGDGILGIANLGFPIQPLEDPIAAGHRMLYAGEDAGELSCRMYWEVAGSPPA